MSIKEDIAKMLPKRYVGTDLADNICNLIASSLPDMGEEEIHNALKHSKCGYGTTFSEALIKAHKDKIKKWLEG